MEPTNASNAPLPVDASQVETSHRDVQQTMEDTVSIDDFDLPRTAIMRVIKSAMEECGHGNMQLQKDAKSAMVKASTVFINYLTTIASDLAIKNRQKTLSSACLIQALEDMDMTEFQAYAEESHKTFKDSLAAKRLSIRKSSTGSGGLVSGQPDDHEDGDDQDDDDEMPEDTPSVAVSAKRPIHDDSPIGSSPVGSQDAMDLDAKRLKQ